MHRLLQLTLDLFEAPAPVTPAPRTPDPRKPPATRVWADPPDRTLPPASFTHAQASRRTVLDGVHVAYEFRRARRRHIGFLVGSEGLTVSAPKWVPLHEVEAALQKKAGWILRKLAEMQARDLRRESARIDWKDGASIPYLGQDLAVVLDPRAGLGGSGPVLHADADADSDAEPGPQASPLRLHLGLPRHAEPAQIRDAAQAWLMRQATRVFSERLEHFAPRLGVQWRKLALSSASTRWGSANTSGAIRLNWRLVHFRLPVIDYVVAHELSHLRVMDHSPRFWETVATVVPDYAQLRAELRADPLPPW